MVTFINPWTGTETYVADERKDKYLRAGFKPALDGVQHTEPEEEPKKKTTKKTTKK